MVGSGAAIAADLLAVSVLISITRQLWDTRVAKKVRHARIANTAHVGKTSVLHGPQAKRTLQTTGRSKLGVGMALARKKAEAQTKKYWTPNHQPRGERLSALAL